jgi:2-dehydro-3-deoxyglucarate aldolase/4-hydroxy-2-oxoheptanedioate aldolase
MSTLSFRELTQNREFKVGVFIGEFTTPGIGHIVKSSGCDFAMVDMEHTGFTFETVKQTLRNLHDAGLASMLRPPSKEYHHIARACDVGAQGIMPPMLGTAEEARRIVDHIKYAPAGNRGVCLGISHDNYGTGPVPEAFAAANAKTSLIALIETGEGIENVDEIAAVDGVDCLWVGHFDLSSSLGIPGQFDHPDFTSAVDRVTAAAKTHNKSLGRLVNSVDQGAELYATGVDMIIYSGDIWLLQTALSNGVKGLRERCKTS